MCGKELDEEGATLIGKKEMALALLCEKKKRKKEVSWVGMESNGCL